MRLIITARASVARVIAASLSTKHQSYKRCEGYLSVEADVVTWCGGHLFELAEPEAYDTHYHHWRLEDLPIIPDSDPASEKAWKIKERSIGHEQLEVIRRFLLEADEVVHAGDPDREGQWMIDEILQYLDNRLPVKRLLLQDLNLYSVRKALKSLRDNKEFIHLSESAMARSRADWLYGINMTRAYTLLGRHSGYEGVLTVGRVQTSVLALVVKRDEAVEQFKAQPYFDVSAKLVSVSGDRYCHAVWKNKSDSLLLDYDASEQLENKIRGKAGRVITVTDTEISEAPPLPFSLSALQIECSKAFGFFAKDTQDVCWQLFEKHHLISYPRSDCRYLPENYFDQSSDVLNAIEKNIPELQENIKKSDCWVKQVCWDDTQITAHHGIIPTMKQMDMTLLSEPERQIYALIASNYVAQFYPDHKYINSDVIFSVEGEEFSISARQEALFAWHASDIVICDDVDVKEKLTRPPARFTDETLMEAMANIAEYVENPSVKNILMAGDGLGTEATRAFVIDGLFKRGFLMKGNKNIFSTAIGRDLVHVMSGQSDQIDLTALWEKNLSDIASGALSYKKFMDDLRRQLTELVQYALEKKTMTLTLADEVLGLKTGEKFYCPKCQSLLVQRSGKHGVFWGCSRYPECKGTLPDIVDKNGRHRPHLNF